MKTLEKHLLGIWIAGSVLTVIVAYELWCHHHKAAAIATIVISPFPCPGPEC